MPSSAASVVRKAGPSDIDELVRIENISFSGDRIAPRSFRSLIRRGSAAILVASDTGKLAGYAVILFRSNSGSARLYSLAVDPARKGNGIGSRLIDAVIGESGHRNCSRLRLEVRVDNDPALGLYRKHGFEEICLLPGYYHDGCDAIRLGKNLRPSKRGQFGKP